MVSDTSARQWHAPSSNGNGGHAHDTRQNGNLSPDGQGKDAERLAHTLGVFSLGLGLAQVLAPQAVARFAGLHGASDTVMRLVGLREIVSGVGLLTQENPTGWVWLRVGGDLMDIALLNAASSSPHVDRERLSAATAAVAGVAAADAFAGMRLISGQGKFPTDSAHYRNGLVADGQVKAAVTVGAPLTEVYAFWEGLGAMSKFMQGVASVEEIGDGKLHWTMTGPAGLTIEFDSEVTEAVPHERISWRTIEGTGIEASGEIRFRTAPGDRGTEVLYNARFTPPGGPLGAKVADLFGSTLSIKMQSDLNRSKQLIELGEIVQSDDSIKPGPNPAQPVPAGSEA